jgi:hypothetical protein
LLPHSSHCFFLLASQSTLIDLMHGSQPYGARPYAPAPHLAVYPTLYPTLYPTPPLLCALTQSPRPIDPLTKSKHRGVRSELQSLKDRINAKVGGGNLETTLARFGRLLRSADPRRMGFIDMKQFLSICTGEGDARLCIGRGAGWWAVALAHVAGIVLSTHASTIRTVVFDNL